MTTNPALKTATLAGAALLVLTLSGCSSTVSTYGGESSFKCAAKFDDGVPCDSISGTAANYSADNLSWQKKDKGPKQELGSASGPVPSVDVEAKLKELKEQPPVFGEATPGNVSTSALAKLSPRQMPTPNTGMPLRIPERVLRIWVAPYEDDDAALNDQKYIYMTVQRGAWQIEANKLKTQNTYKQIYPLGRPAAPVDDASANSRASARSQAQGALINNPNLTGAQTPATGAAQADE